MSAEAPALAAPGVVLEPRMGHYLPLTLNQEYRLLLCECRQPQTPPPASQCLCFEFNGALEPKPLQEALNQLVRFHGAFRMVSSPNLDIPGAEREARIAAFRRCGMFSPGLFVQSLADEFEVPLSFVDLSNLAPDKQEAEVRAACDLGSKSPFDLSTVPLLRATAIKKSPVASILILYFDDLTLDSWSIGIIQSQLDARYKIAAGIEKTPLPAHADFREFVLWQNSEAAAICFEESIAYWMGQWAEFGSGRIAFEDLPFAQPQPAGFVPEFARERLELTAEESFHLQSAACQTGTSLHMLFLTALAILLRHYTGKQRLSIWEDFPNRTGPFAGGMIGPLANSHLLGFDFSSDLSMQEAVERTCVTYANARQRQHMPLPYLWNTAGFHPLSPGCQIVLRVAAEDHLRDAVAGTTAPGSFRQTHSTLPLGPGPLTIELDAGRERISLLAQYVKRVFPKLAIQHLLFDLRDTATLLARRPEARIRDVFGLRLRCAKTPKSAGGMMDEFVVAGSDLIAAIDGNK